MQELTKTFHQFLALPLYLQMAVIREVKNDRALFRLFSANRHTWSLFKTSVHYIFDVKTSLLTDQPLTSFLFHRAKIYLSRQQQNKLYIKQKEENHTALSFMVFNGFEKTARLYMDAMKDRSEMRHRAQHGFNLLMLAILSRNFAMVDLILAQPEAPQLIDEVDTDGNQAIHFAAQVGDKSILKRLVRHPAFSPELVNVNGGFRYSPVAHFCKHGASDDPDFLDALVEYGAWIGSRASCYDGSAGNGFLNDPIYLAIVNEKPRVALRLLLAFEKEDIRKYIQSPIFILKKAIQKGYKEVVISLIERGVDSTNQNVPEKSLLVSAIASGDVDLIKIAFQIESSDYEKVLFKKIYHSRGQEFYLPVFADYLLCAINALMQCPASKKTMDIYHVLMEFGFNVSMLSHYEFDNVFHRAASNLTVFMGKTEESIFCAEKIIFDLLAMDLDHSARNKPDRKGASPVQLLPCSDLQSLSESFEEKVKALFSDAKQALANKHSESSDAVEVDEDEVDFIALPSHNRFRM